MKKLLLILVLVMPLFSCSHQSPMATVDHVDIDRFMGDWYVIANIPTFFERGAHNAIESYKKNDDGTIATTFTFRDGSFDGDLKAYHPKGFIIDSTTNALWGMQFIWPIKADYRIVYLDQNYTQTIIARKARDYVWVMARRPQISKQDYQKSVQLVESIGYDVSKMVQVPQSWPEQAATQP